MLEFTFYREPLGGDKELQEIRRYSDGRLTSRRWKNILLAISGMVEDDTDDISVMVEVDGRYAFNLLYCALLENLYAVNRLSSEVLTMQQGWRDPRYDC